MVPWPVPPPRHVRARRVFLASLGLSALVAFLPHGGYIGYPLLLLSTLAHELGHGLTAVLVGGDFHSFQLWSDGSGVAEWSGQVGRGARALVAAGGLVGPALAALGGFLLGRGPRRARALLLASGGFLALALVWVVRNPFAWLYIGLVAAALLAVGLRAQDWLVQLAVVFLSVQLAASVFQRGDYLFTAVAETAAGPAPSDVAAMADALLLPYWFWGAICAAFSAGVLLVGLLGLLRGEPAPRLPT